MTAPAFREHPRLWTADQFLDFYASRPEGERWQLVDGLAMMIVPPNLVHQRISGNLERLLNDALEAHRPDLYAYRETGIRIPGVNDFNPEPDVVCLPRRLTTGTTRTCSFWSPKCSPLPTRWR